MDKNPTTVILELLRDSKASTSAVAADLGKPAAAANSILTSLKNKGLIKNSKTNEGLIWELGRSEDLGQPKDKTPPKNRWPLAPGTRIYPKVKTNSCQFGLKELDDGEAIIIKPAKEAGCYVVRYDGDSQDVVYGPVLEKDLTTAG